RLVDVAGAPAAILRARAGNAGAKRWRGPTEGSTRAGRSGSKYRRARGGGQGGEDRKGVGGGPVCFAGPTRGRHHGNGRVGRAQIVVAHRKHAERREQFGGGGQFGRAAHPDGAVPLGGDPSHRAQAFGPRVTCHVIGVDLSAHLDQRGVGGHL